MIREYRDADRDNVLRLWFEASKIAHPFLTAEFLTQEREKIRDVYLPNARSWVCERNGEVVGFIALVGSEVGGLFVTPSCQRSGVGGALVDTVRNLHPVLEVEVFKENAIGRSFYERYGFHPIEESIDAETGRQIVRLRYVV